MNELFLNSFISGRSRHFRWTWFSLAYGHFSACGKNLKSETKIFFTSMYFQPVIVILFWKPIIMTPHKTIGTFNDVTAKTCMKHIFLTGHYGHRIDKIFKMSKLSIISLHSVNRKNRISIIILWTTSFLDSILQL